MTQPTFSVIVPAYDEERLVQTCLDAISAAARSLGEPVEIIVVDNMSQDRTREMAIEHGAKVIQVEEKCLSIIRNRGAAAASGKYLCFIDADSFMSDNMLVEVKKALDSGHYVGGGVMNVRTDRSSLGITLTMYAAGAAFLLTRMSLVMFYTTPEAFRAIGDFNEKLYAIEDADFGRRLKRHGRKLGLRYKNLWSARVTTSARKFDEFGDWFIFLHPIRIGRAVFNDREAVYDLWYRPRR